MKSRINILLLLCSLFAMACRRELSVNDNFPFEVTSLPVPKEVSQGERIEIRFTLTPQKRLDGQSYTVRYFQHKGKATVTLGSKELLPNDRYGVPAGDFRVYVTPGSSGSQVIELTFEDGRGHVQSFNYSFTVGKDNLPSDTPSEDTIEIIPTSLSGRFRAELLPSASTLLPDELANLIFRVNVEKRNPEQIIHIRSFQRAGKGTVYKDGKPMQANRPYEIDPGTFGLQFRYRGEPAYQHIEFVIEDNFSRRENLVVEFNNPLKNEKKEL